jgi:hypothetical protein
MKAISTGKRKKFDLHVKTKKDEKPEANIEKSYASKTNAKVSQVDELPKNDSKEETAEEIKIKSSFDKREKNINSSAGTIDWGTFDISSLVNKMAKFSEMLTGFPLYPYQVEPQKRIFESVLRNDGAEITLLQARQSGKSEVVACTAATLLVLMPVLARAFPDKLGIYKSGLHIGLFAPSSEQAATTHTRIDERLSTGEDILVDPDLNAAKKYQNGFVSIDGGDKSDRWRSYCRLQSAAKQSRIESKSYHVILIDETQEIDEVKIQKSIHPMGAAYNSTILKLGTPSFYIGDFYNAIQRNLLSRKRGRSRDHFEYDYNTVQRYNKRYKSFIEREKDRLGEDSDAFRMSYKLEWPLEKGMALTKNQFDELMRTPSLRWEHGGMTETYVAGIDVARDDDSTVVTVLKLGREYETKEDFTYITRDKVIANTLELTNQNWEQQIDLIRSFLQAYNIKAIALDATGVGSPIYERLEKLYEDQDIYVMGIKFTPQSKSDMAMLFQKELFSKRLKVPAHPSVTKTARYKKFIEQFTTAIKKYKDSYVYFCHQDIKGAHDDFVDSYLLALWASENMRQKPVETSRENVLMKPDRQNRSKRYVRAMFRKKRNTTSLCASERF